MQDVIDRAFYIDVVGYIVMDEGEILRACVVSDVVRVAGEQVVNANDFVPFFDKQITEV
jgi:hypothetical protein